MNESNKRKMLIDELIKTEGNAELLKNKAINAQKEYKAIKDKVQILKNKIKILNINVPVRVSDHALVRYLERVEKIDMSVIEKEILTNEVLRLIDTLGGSGRYPNKNFKVVMNNYTVTTII